jgi:GT2 family glycosyltransferase
MRDIALGVVIVAFNSGQEIIDCAESLLAAAARAGVALRVALVDNGSTDDTADRIRAWASSRAPYAAEDNLPFPLTPVPKPLALAEGGPDMAASPGTRLALIDSGMNRGFAGGVNVGLAWLARHPDIAHFWVLNPDTVVPPEALGALADTLPGLGPYALAGGRVTYLAQPDIIQIDGGTLNRWTGVTGNLNLHASHSTTPEPDAAAMDFVMGGSMIASRAFYERAGPMREGYFLYYAVPCRWFGCPGCGSTTMAGPRSARRCRRAPPRPSRSISSTGAG